MKITAFDPIIASPKADDVISVFEALGFDRTHAPVTELEAGDVKSIRMKHANGYHVDVAYDINGIPQDFTLIRMNVDNFAEAYDILTAHGFKNTRGDDTIDTKSAKAATMVSPSGFRIALVQHIKDHD
jgi:hypothetical protein